MFQQRHTGNVFQASLTTIALIYHMTVYQLRKSDRNAVVGLMTVIGRSMIMVIVFYLIFYVVRVRSSPIRGNFIVYIMSGIFMFMTHNMAMQKVMRAEGSVSALMKHAPLYTAITITASALSVLYQQFLACVVLLLMTNTFIEPLGIDRIYPCIAMFLLAWFSGCCLGILFLALDPWWPHGVQLISQFYMRANMITSGKMFVANTMPSSVVAMFSWNPLFHLIDQTRGFAFVNYTPHNSSVYYPVYFSIIVALIGLMGEFFTRSRVSLSWSATR